MMIGELPMLTKGPIALFYGGRSHMIQFNRHNHKYIPYFLCLGSGSEIEPSLSSDPAGNILYFSVDLHHRKSNFAIGTSQKFIERWICFVECLLALIPQKYPNINVLWLLDKYSGNHITVLCLASSTFLIAAFAVKKAILRRKISQSNLLKEAIVSISCLLKQSCAAPCAALYSAAPGEQLLEHLQLAPPHWPLHWSFHNGYNSSFIITSSIRISITVTLVMFSIDLSIQVMFVMIGIANKSSSPEPHLW